MTSCVVSLRQLFERGFDELYFIRRALFKLKFSVIKGSFEGQTSNVCLFFGYSAIVIDIIVDFYFFFTNYY